jgi:hypothetical protein
MPLTFTTTAAGASSDYIRYLEGKAKKVDKQGQPTTLEFTLVPVDGSFVKLVRGNYIKFDTVTYPNWFTGFITNAPEYEYLGTKSGVPTWGYRYKAVSDEYLLNLKPIGLVPPFVNMTMGAILRYLVGVLAPGLYTTTGILDGPTISRYVPDPEKTFSQIVQDFCDKAQYKFRANNMALTFKPQDSGAIGITVDGSNKHFSPNLLDITPSTDPVINEAVVMGAVEPQNYINEYWYGDGLTGTFPLLESIYGTDRTLLLDEVFSGNTLDSSKWTEFDDANDWLKVANGYLNALGGNFDHAFNRYVTSANLIPLEGTLRITHGEWDFVNTGTVNRVQGIIGGLWTTTPNYGDGANNFPGCIFGIRVMRWSDGTVHVTPLYNSVLNGGQDLQVDTTKRYIIRTMLVADQAARTTTAQNYLSSSGVVTSVSGTNLSTAVTMTTTLTEINPSTGAVTNTTTWTSSTTLNSAQLYAYYVPMVTDDLHATVSGITISKPMEIFLEQKPSGGSFSTKYVGPNDLDSFDGTQPIATITSSNSGAVTRSSMLGTRQYNPGSASLTYFKDTTKQISYVPGVGELIHLRYRSAGASTARVRDNSSISSEASLWGDNGVRSKVFTKLDPLPRTSVDCEATASAIVGDNNYQRYQGSFTQVSTFFTAEPYSGGILSFTNLPSGLLSVPSLEVNTVETEMISSRPSELFSHKLSFGQKDVVNRFVNQYRQPTDVFAPEDSAEIPSYINPAGVGLAFAPDVIAPTFTSLTSTDLSFNTNQAAPTVPNLLLWTQAFDNAAWSTSGGVILPTITANAATAPDGTATADVLVWAGATTSYGIGQQITPTADILVAGQRFTFSCWMKVASGTANLSLLLEDQAFGFVTTTAFALTTSWQRFSITGTMLSTSTGIKAFLYNPSSAAATYHVWGAQLEAGNVCTPYFKNDGSRTTAGGFEVRYSDESWGVDDAKNLITRTSSQTFSIPRSVRGRIAYVKAYDARNYLKNSEDLTGTGWSVNGAVTRTNSSQTDPDGNTSTVTSVAFPASAAANIFQISTVPAQGSTACFSISMKGTAGNQVRIRIESETSPFPGTNLTVTFNGKWQRVSVSNAWAASDPYGLITVIVQNFTGVAQTVLMTRASAEAGSSETVYCKTLTTAYGANSRFAAGLRCSFPLVPSAPTSATIDITDYINPKITVGLPTNQQDIWGIEVRASDNSTVLYKKDLVAAEFNPVITVAGNNKFSLSYFVYFYNLLGEYSSSYNATTTLPTILLEKATTGKNAVYNPSFELNNTGTVHNNSTYYTTEAIYLCDDWYNESPSNTMWRFHLDSPSYTGDTSASYSGNYSFRAELKPSLAIPNGTTNSEFRVKSNLIKVTPGDTVVVAARMRWDANTFFPAGVSAIQRIGIVFRQADGTDISEHVADLTGGVGWTLKAKAAVAPSNAAYAEVELAAFVSNSSGSTFNTSTNIYAQLRWDDIYFASQSTTLEHSGVNTGNTPSPNPLSQSGTATTINVSSFSIYYGFGTVSYNSGSITGLAYGVKYYVFVDDPSYSGGSVSYQQTTNSRDLTNQEGRIYIGSITLSAGGGGVGGGGGSGACLVAGTPIRLFNGTEKPVETLTLGDVLMSPYETEGAEFQSMDVVEDVQLYRITLSDGRSITCSGKHHILVNGLWLRVEDVYWPNAKVWCEGEEIGLPATCETLGTGTVYRLHLSSPHIYLGGGVWSHNMIDPSNK